MADQHNADSGGAFTRAFLPGLILGLVVGGLAGAVLPDIIGGGRSLPPIDPDTLSGERSPREGDQLPEDVQRQIDEAQDAAEQTADDAAEAVDDAADGAKKAIDDAVGDDGP